MELVKLNVTLDGIIEPLHQVDDRALADPRRAKYNCRLMGLDGE